jgi:hypothetical protein
VFSSVFLSEQCDIMLFAGQPPGGPPPGGSGSAGSTPPCWQPECVPIDGGIGLLLAAGAVIGARKLYGTKA